MRQEERSFALLGQKRRFESWTDAIRIPALRDLAIRSCALLNEVRLKEGNKEEKERHERRVQIQLEPKKDGPTKGEPKNSLTRSISYELGADFRKHESLFTF